MNHAQAAIPALAGDEVTRTPVLDLRCVSWGPKRHPDILRGISFTLAEGEVLAICGANGAGKSSLLRLLYRYHAPRSGTVKLVGRDIWHQSAREVAQVVAAVLQEQPTDFALTARQIVALGRLPHQAGFGAGARDAAVVAETLRRLDLTAVADRAFGTLSGGERQRVMVARALAQEPRVLILDEPTNHLDIRHQLELLTLLRGLGLGIVTTLHDLTIAAEFADRVMILSDGGILADAAPLAALSADNIAAAFKVTARIDTSGPAPRFSFQLQDQR